MDARFFILAVAAALAACTPPAPEAPPAAEIEAIEYASVNAPSPNVRVTSPLTVSGVAPNTWYFEAQFDAQLIGADGAVIAEAPARAQTDWTVPGAVPYAATFEFNVTADTPVTILLRQYRSEEAGEPAALEVRVPVVLAPPG